MKRPNFDIYLNGEYVYTKYAFNSAANSIPDWLIENYPNRDFKLTDSSINRVTKYGTRLWVSNLGEEFPFEIVKKG